MQLMKKIDHGLFYVCDLMKQSIYYAIDELLLASQKTAKGEKNDSGLHRCQNQMCPSS